MQLEELIERCRLTERELDLLAEIFPLLDFSFEDDYGEEVAEMREALLRKAIPVIQKAERERFRGIVIPELQEISEGFSFRDWARLTRAVGKIRQALKGVEDGQ